MKDIIEEDIFEVFQRLPKAVLIHQANCQNAMGSGIARIIRERFPKAWEADCDADKDGRNTPGNISLAEVDGPEKVIVNMYGQDKCTRTSLGDRDTSYDAVYDALKEIFTNAFDSEIDKEYTFLFPYGMSSDLAGARWPIIQSMIETLGAKFNIIVCRLPGKPELT